MQSEWGQINRGAQFVMVTIDLVRAITMAPWGRYELPIVGYLLEHSWGTATRSGRRGGYGEPTPVNIPIRALARAAGVPHTRLVEAKRGLIAGRVIIPCGDGWTLNKRADEWSDSEGLAPRLGLDVATYCHQPTLSGGTPQRTSAGTPQRTTSAEGGTPQRTGVVRPSVPNGTPQRTSATIEERTRVLRERDKEENTPLKGGGETDAEEEAATRELVSRIGDLDAATVVNNARAIGVPMAWSVLAVDACMSRKGWFDLPYVSGILRGYKRDGGPPVPRVAGTIPSRPTIAKQREEKAQRIAAMFRPKEESSHVG